MRQRLSTIGVILLVLAIVAVGLGACARSAEVRESPDATSEDTGGTSGQGTIPEPGETVVSAVTPIAGEPGTEGQTTPETGGQPTFVPVGETPGAVQPLPTTAPGATAVPPASQPLPPSGPDGAIQHTVQQGETLYSIAQRYGTTVQAITQANNLVSTSQIYPGQSLMIPTSGSSSGPSGGTSGCRIRHTVQQGEWVWQIARNYGVSPYDILAVNGLTIQSADPIYPGTVLCIP